MKIKIGDHSYNKEEFYKTIARLGQRALYYEVLLTPKPGLVDRQNNGSHEDMDVFTFVDSTLSLYDYFYSCTQSGYEYDGLDYGEILKIIRPMGIRAEKDMFSATKGINTHKGAIFIFGILCAAIGSLYRDDEYKNYDKICYRGGEISFGITGDLNSELKFKENLTYGEHQFLQYGSFGIRGEAENGFPSLRGTAKDAFLNAVEKGFSTEIAMGESLLELMRTTFDSNIVGRGGLNALEFAKSKATTAISLGGYKTKDGIAYIQSIDRDFISKNLSPGGCADLCAAIIFLFFVCSL